MKRISRFAFFISLFFLVKISPAFSAPAIGGLTPVTRIELGEKVDIKPQLSLDGGKIDLKNYIGKKAVIIAFWLQSCDDCLQQIKSIGKFVDSKKLSGKIEIITMTRAREGVERDFVKSILKKNGIKFKTMIDPSMVLPRKFGVTEIPAYVIIDSSGRLAIPELHFPQKKIRDMNFFDFIESVAAGKKLKPIQFVEYTKIPKFKKMIGKPAPDFTLNSTMGAKISLSDYKDSSNVVLVFWHPYVEFSAIQIRKLSFYYNEKRPRYNFAVLAVSSLRNTAQTDAVDKFIKDTQPDFPILIDKTSSAGKLYGVTTTPTVFIINKKGIIIDVLESENFNMITYFNYILESIN